MHVLPRAVIYAYTLSLVRSFEIGSRVNTPNHIRQEERGRHTLFAMTDGQGARVECKAGVLGDVRRVYRQYLILKKLDETRSGRCLRRNYRTCSFVLCWRRRWDDRLSIRA